MRERSRICQQSIDTGRLALHHADMKKAKKNPHAVALGRKGGKKGGPARAAKLTAEQRKASARKAAQARWDKSRNA
jgi:hypothetical protein